MPNEVLIVVKARNDTKPIFDRIRQDSVKLGDEIGGNLTDRVSKKMEAEARSGNSGYGKAGDAIGKTVSDRISNFIARTLGRTNTAGLNQAGDAMGDTIGRRVADRINERVSRSVNNRAGSGGLSGNDRSSSRGGSGGAGGAGGDATADIDRPGFLSRMLNLGKEAGGRLTSGIGGVVSGFFGSDVISLMVKAIAGSGLVGMLAPVLGAAVNSAFALAVGGGVLAVGIAGAFQDPRVKGAMTQLKGMFKKEFADFGQFFVPGVARFMERLVTDIGPQLKPLTERLGEIFRPLTIKLGDGLIGFLQNVLPGLSRFAEKTAPFWEALAESLPGLGDDMGRFFDHLSNGAPGATVFIKDFVNGVGLMLRGLGRLIATLSNAYLFIRLVFVQMVDSAMSAFDKILSGAAIAFWWVPGVGEKLRGAAKKFSEFRKDVNRELDLIRDETVTVTIRQVYTTVGSAAVNVGRLLGKATGGIQGAATGGVRNGLTWVGEQGPELVQLPVGSRVNSNPDSMRMAGAGTNGGDTPIIVQMVLDAAVVAEALVDPQRRLVRQRFGGSVQAAWGKSA